MKRTYNEYLYTFDSQVFCEQNYKYHSDKDLQQYQVPEKCPEFDSTKQGKNFKPFEIYKTVPSFISQKWGQRKLLLTEIMFFSMCGVSSTTEKIRIIYAGAAPCDHIYTLQHLFNGNQYSYDLIDPARWNPDFVYQHPELGSFNNSEEQKQYQINENTTVYHGYFTDKLAHELGKKYTNDRILFLSDIRPTDIDSSTSTIKDREQIIKQNMKMQQEWFKIIQSENQIPERVWCMLKFKPTFEIEMDEYLDGTLFYQPWTRLKSPELRLITNKATYKKYDTKWLECHLTWYNEIQRNTLVDRSRDYRMNRLWDSQIEYDICEFYRSKVTGKFRTTIDMMFFISKQLGPKWGGLWNRQWPFQKHYQPPPYQVKSWNNCLMKQMNKYSSSISLENNPQKE